MLVWALAVPASGGVISNVGVIPSPFSPNADGVFDSTAVYYSLSEQAAIVLSVADSTGAWLWTLWSGWENEGTHSHWWDGLFDGSPVTDGEYRFLIEAIPEYSPYEETAFPFVVDTEPPPLHDVDVAPSRFSPDGDGVGDSLMISFLAGISEPSDQVLVTVLDEDDEPVRQVYSATGVASAVLFWDGADEASAVASDGLFFVKVETRDAAGNQAESGALVDLDTAPPVLDVDYPDTTTMELRVQSSVADLTGWAHDRAGVISVELSLDQEEWTEVAIGRPDTVRWAGSVACASCIPDTLDEILQVFVRAHDGTPTADGEGHVNGPSASIPVLSFDVIFDVAPPEHQSSTVSGGVDAFAPSETITITSRWDDTDYNITADFGQVDSEFDPADVSVSEITGGRYTITYEISETNSFVPVVDAPVIITATDYFLRSVADTTVTVTVLSSSSGGPTVVAVSVNSFEPLAGGEVVVTLGSYEGPATVCIYNMAGTLVRTLESQHDEISWHGDNDAGDSVASGVYFLRIQ
ncbi:MAG: T9SS type A sorting domain-containing protein, partial [Candidatus Eisenbacteria sp.]|nr:T9SS type A sorting domain-containing protein [Candidatus Eisenbacteria bacterium]